MDNKTNYEVWNKLYRFLLKDVKDFNSYILSFVSILIILLAGFVSYFVMSDSSFAWFSQTIRSNNNINVKVSLSGGSNSESAANFLMKKVGYSGLDVITHEADSTLQIGNTSDITEYRYRGSDEVVTNNYVYFNCSDINNQTSQTCELYRIIGVFPVDDGTGKIENRVKLIKSSYYTNDSTATSWERNNYFTWNESRINNWAEPATLNTEFNINYYSSINEEFEKLIGNSKFYMGGFESALVTRDMLYKSERKILESGGYLPYWTGKIALMYASDFGYGASDLCDENVQLIDYGNSLCFENNWLLLKGDYEWLLTRVSIHDFEAFYIEELGFMFSVAVSSHDLGGSFRVRPVFYLTADAMFNDIGDGSFDNPYQLMEK